MLQYAQLQLQPWLNEQIFYLYWNEQYDDGMQLRNIMDCGHRDANNDRQTWSLLLSTYYNKQNKWSTWNCQPRNEESISSSSSDVDSVSSSSTSMFVFFFVPGNNSLQIDPHRFRFRNDTSMKSRTDSSPKTTYHAGNL